MQIFGFWTKTLLLLQAFTAPSVRSQEVHNCQWHTFNFALETEQDILLIPVFSKVILSWKGDPPDCICKDMNLKGHHLSICCTNNSTLTKKCSEKRGQEMQDMGHNNIAADSCITFV